MRLILDKEHMVETFTQKCKMCENCEIEGPYYDYDEYKREIKLCNDCEDCQKHGDCSEVVFKGYIGEAFCDFMSLDFEEIIRGITTYICNNIDKYIHEQVTEEEIGNTLLKHFLFGTGYWGFNYLWYGVFDKSITYDKILHRVESKFGKILCYKQVINKAVGSPEFLRDSSISAAVNDLLRFPMPVSELTPDDSINRFEKVYESPENVIDEILELATAKPAEDNIARYQAVDLDTIAGMFFELLHSTEYVIKKCRNCGKYFIPQNRSDEIYCDRVCPQDKQKSCKEYGAQATYKEKLKNDQTLMLYRRIYMQKQMLVKRNPDIELYKSDFEDFKSDAKKWKKDVKENRKTKDEYLCWLKTFRKSEV